MPKLIEVMEEHARISAEPTDDNLEDKPMAGLCENCGNWSDVIKEIEGRALCEDCQAELEEGSRSEGDSIVFECNGELEEFTLVDEQRRSTIALSQLGEFLTSFQLGHRPASEVSCPICNLDLAEERIRYESDAILIVDTKIKKGHKERIMVLTRKHGVQRDMATIDEAVRQVIAAGRQVFKSDFALLSDRFSTVNYPWHIVASDIDPRADDYL